MLIARLSDAGLRLERADLAVVAARPALAPVRAAMEARIAELADVTPDRISVKGTTSDGLGFTGEDGIAAYAIAVVETGPLSRGRRAAMAAGVGGISSSSIDTGVADVPYSRTIRHQRHNQSQM